jgi:hypothetical protein
MRARRRRTTMMTKKINWREMMIAWKSKTKTKIVTRTATDPLPQSDHPHASKFKLLLSSFPRQLL